MAGLINSDEIAIVNQILPHKNKWAWDLFLKGAANNWMPTEISMKKDIEQWKSLTILSEDERLVVRRCLGFFAGSESLVANNLLLSIFKYITDGECRQYIARQIYEESLHNLTIVYICDSLKLKINEVYEAYKSIPAIKAKDDFLINITNDINRQDYTSKTLDGKIELLRNIITYYIICEGIFFYSGFAMLLSFGRQNKLPGIAEQIQYTLRDECISYDSELLTNNGWKNVKDITYDTKIAQYDTDGVISFVNPIKISKSFSDTIFNYSNKEHSVDLSVSKNHRMVFKNLKNNKLVIKNASDFNHHPYSAHITAGTIQENNLSLTWMERFKIALQADGNIHNYGYHNGNYCGYIRTNFTFSKQSKITRFKNILNHLNTTFTEKVEDNITIFHVNVPISDCTKEFSEWVKLDKIGLNWCKEFIDELSYWDTHKVESNRFVYCSTNKSNIDLVQAICTLANYKTNINVSHDDRQENYKDYYRMSIFLDCNYFRGNVIHKQELDYNNYVYGFEVPSGMIITRLNDCVSITGNSLHIQFGVSLTNQICEEYPEIWSKQFQERTISHIEKAVDLEVQYAKDVLPRGILGLNSNMFVDYMKFIANRRLEMIKLKPIYNNVYNPFAWMSEVIDLNKMKNFFETRVTDYQTGTLEDDL